VEGGCCCYQSSVSQLSKQLAPRKWPIVHAGMCSAGAACLLGSCGRVCITAWHGIMVHGAGDDSRVGSIGS
jgi:hypothetical protein